MVSRTKGIPVNCHIWPFSSMSFFMGKRPYIFVVFYSRKKAYTMYIIVAVHVTQLYSKVVVCSLKNQHFKESTQKIKRWANDALIWQALLHRHQTLLQLSVLEGRFEAMALSHVASIIFLVTLSIGQTQSQVQSSLNNFRTLNFSPPDLLWSSKM